jgi:two-component system, sensor histidine kinase LadS
VKKSPFLFIFLFFSLTLNGALLTLEKESIPSVYENISYFEDRDGKFSFEEIKSEEFTPHEKKSTPNFGFTESIYWFKIDIHNRALYDDIDWWLKIDYPLLECVDIYLLKDDGRLIKHQHLGTSHSPSSRDVVSHYFISKLPLKHISDSTLYLRVQTQSSMQLPLSIFSSKTLMEELEENNFFVGVYYGIFFIVLLYNMVLFIYTRDQNYLRYIMFLITFILWQLSFDGLGAKYIWGNIEWLIDHGSATFIALTSFCALYFSRHFLNTPLYTPNVDNLIIAMMVVSLLMSLASSVLPYGAVIPINASIAAFMPVLLLTAGLAVMRHEYRAARFYVAGWSSLLIATVIFAFNKFDLIPSFYGVNNVQQIGSAIEMIFLSLALADRVYLLQREYIEKLNHLNDTLTEKVESALSEARLKDRLFVQQSRLAAMGEMIEQIAHQWRQPLNTLALINQDTYVKHKLGKCDDRCFEESHQNIDHHLQYLSKTIDDFRNFYKADKSKSVEEVGNLAAESLRLSDVFLKYAKIKTRLNIVTNRKVNIAKNEMIQVLMNLIKNAHDAIIERKIKEGIITIDVEECAEGIKISVNDNAGGIAPNMMEKIFDIYFTTKDPEHGSGLGLHMSKYIIEESFGGKIWAENKKSGACFIIVLPFYEKDTLVERSE